MCHGTKTWPCVYAHIIWNLVISSLEIVKSKPNPLTTHLVFCKNWPFHIKLLPTTSYNFNWGGSSSSFVTSNRILLESSMPSSSWTQNHPTSMVVPWCTHACPPIHDISHVAITTSLVGLIKNTESPIWNYTSITTFCTT